MTKKNILKSAPKTGVNLLGYFLVFVFTAFIFFAVGYASRGLSLPDFLGGNSKVVVDSSVNVDVSDIYKTLVDKFDGDISTEEAEDGIKQGLVSATGDPYTTYFSEEQYKEFTDSLNGNFSGIGAQLGAKDGGIVVIAPLDGFPAQKAGLLAGDYILKVDNNSIEGLSVDEAVRLIRGPTGEAVTLGIARDGQYFEIKIIREGIHVDSVKWELLDGGIGYIKISSFSQDTAQLAIQAVKELSSQGAEKYVLDLRNNGGGYVDSAVQVAGIWLDNKVVLSERFKGQETKVRRTSSNSKLIASSDNLVVLVNEGTASASEILAATLRDNAGVKLVGQKTFGKGSVQDIVPLSNGGRLKVTIAHWYTPGGVNLDEDGLSPDALVELGAGDSVPGSVTDQQKSKALELLAQ